MGKLIKLSDAALTALWFFDDAYYSGTNRNEYTFNWPSANFPNYAAIHETCLTLPGQRPKIRRWIENTITDTVIFDVVDMSYKKHYTTVRRWDSMHDVRNMWYRFHFEDIHSLLMFKIAFSDVIKELTKWHPGSPEDEIYLMNRENDVHN